MVGLGVDMPITFSKSLGQGSSKTSGTSLVLTVNKTVTPGNDIFVAFASDPASGTYSVTDSLGNTYTSVAVDLTGSGTSGVRTQFLRATVGGAGVATLNSITISHPSLAARGAIAVEFSGVGAVRATGIDNFSSTHNQMQAYPTGAGAENPGVLDTPVVGELWIGAFGIEGGATSFAAVTVSGGVPAQEPTIEQRTTGGASGTNIATGLLYWIADTTTNGRLLGQFAGASGNIAAAGAAISEGASVPVASIVSTSRTKISSVAGFDTIDVVWSSNKDFTEYQFRVVNNASDPVTQGVQIEANQNPASGGTANTQYTSTITDDEVLASSPAEGNKIVKLFVQNASGWSA